MLSWRILDFLDRSASRTSDRARCVSEHAYAAMKRPDGSLVPLTMRAPCAALQFLLHNQCSLCDAAPDARRRAAFI